MIATRDSWGSAKARVRIRHQRRDHFDEKRRLWVYKNVDDDEDIAVPTFEEVSNLLNNAGRVQAHTQCYATTSLLTNGFNYIGLSNDAGGAAAGHTALASEIAANGLSRAQGTVTLASGSGNQTTVDKTFTASGTQSAQLTALFTAASVGVMNHEAAFTQRNLINTDTIQVTFTITLG
jgi:hypothetical protein